MEQDSESMKVFTTIVFFLQLLYGQDVHYKMIVSSHIESKEAAKNLYKVEKFFSENKEAQALKEKHNLTLGMELLDKYILITVKPIENIFIKNALQYTLQKEFPESFIVGNIVLNDIETQQHLQKQVERVAPINQQVDKREKAEQEKIVIIDEPKEHVDGLKLFWKELDSEWLGLLFLALAGLLLIYRSATQISKIKELQQEVIKYQSKLEKEVDDMGERHE